MRKVGADLLEDEQHPFPFPTHFPLSYAFGGEKGVGEIAQTEHDRAPIFEHICNYNRRAVRVEQGSSFCDGHSRPVVELIPSKTGV